MAIWALIFASTCSETEGPLQQSKLVKKHTHARTHAHTHTHTHLTTLCPWLPKSASTRKVKPIWILLKQETVSGSGISWAICKSAPRQTDNHTSTPPLKFFYRPDALLATQPTASKHWRQNTQLNCDKFHNDTNSCLSAYRNMVTDTTVSLKMTSLTISVHNHTTSLYFSQLWLQ